LWLRLLEQSVREQLDAGQPLSETQRFLAGLTRVQFLYLDTKNQDCILEGPAEDRWQVAADGSAIGAQTSQPLLQLDDWVIALRNELSRGPAPSISLDPRAESLQAIREQLRGARTPRTDAERDALADRLQAAWGEQDAVSGGVPHNSRFNRVMVHADWEMKRISLGLRETRVPEFKPYIELEFDEYRRRAARDPQSARPPMGSRFWFYPAYDALERTSGLDAVAIPANGVQLLTESYFRNQIEGRQAVDAPTTAATRFAAQFSTHYDAIAANHAIYSELRNLFDLVVVARLFTLIEVARRIQWNMDFWLTRYRAASIDVPRTMPGLVALRHGEVRSQQSRFAVVFPAWGGVSVDRRAVPDAACWRRSARLESARRAATHDRPRGWWCDVPTPARIPASTLG
jgi:hypothetical protein